MLLRHKEWPIPPGTPVGMTSLHFHENEDMFPDHYAFKPERWLPLQTEKQRLLKYIVAFEAGFRSCVGCELGKAKSLTTMATVFRTFWKNMDLCDTYREADIDMKHHYLNPAPSDESNGLMVSFNRKSAARLRRHARVTGKSTPGIQEHSWLCKSTPVFDSRYDLSLESHNIPILYRGHISKQRNCYQDNG